MKTLFDIGKLAKDERDKLLLMEIGNTYCLLSVCYKEDKKVTALKAFSFEESEMADRLKQIIEEFKFVIGPSDTVVVSSAFSPYLLIPKKLYKEDATILHRLYNLQNSHQLSDHVGEWQLMNVYSLPNEVHQLLTNQFAEVTFLQAHTPSLKHHNGFDVPFQIAVNFIQNTFRVVVKKQQQLQLVQSYFYSSPEDVVYCLLKICEEFQLPQEETYLLLSGLIEVDSTLYKELYQYFLHLHFLQPSFISLPENNLPQHYFASLHNLAACVS